MISFKFEITLKYSENNSISYNKNEDGLLKNLDYFDKSVKKNGCEISFEKNNYLDLNENFKKPVYLDQGSSFSENLNEISVSDNFLNNEKILMDISNDESYQQNKENGNSVL